MNKIFKFLNTALGSYLKVFVPMFSVVWAKYGVDLFDGSYTMCKLIIGVLVGATFPVIVNAVNPEDKRYGKKVSKLPNLPTTKVI